jgi:hypothetical protein
MGIGSELLPEKGEMESPKVGSFTLTGFTADLVFWKKHTTFHVGIEKIVSVIGLDVGPTIFFQDGEVQAGLSLIPFAGIILMGYYEFAWPVLRVPFKLGVGI